MTRATNVQKVAGQTQDRQNYINQLPVELLLKILEQLGKLPPDGCPECESPATRFPFRTLDVTGEPHPGLRSYPFLGQVCKHWKSVLSTPQAINATWHELVVDFGHELITAVHTPIAWSDMRPSDEEFKESFSKTKLDASKILAFMDERKSSLQRVSLMSSEGYVSDEGEFVSLKSKHNFTMASFGMMCGLLKGQLRELTIMRCSDYFDVNSGGLDTIVCLPKLKVLRIEDMSCRISQDSVAKLSKLTQLTELALSIQYNHSTYSWLIGLDRIPQAWSSLVCLEKLVLRGHSHLTMLPHFLLKLPLTHLDISFNKMLNFELISHMTKLQTLCMQGLNLTEEVPAVDPDIHDLDAPPRMLPDLSTLKNLTALNLCENGLTAVPSMLSKMTGLQYLDLSANELLKVPKPLTHMYGMTNLRLVDLRQIQVEPLSYWSEEKCLSMRNVSSWLSVLKRKRDGHVKILLDTDH